MTEKSEYPYEPDQFDREADLVGAHGAHSVDEPAWKHNIGATLAIAVGIVALIAALWFVFSLSSNDGGGSFTKDPVSASDAGGASDGSKDAPGDGDGSAEAPTVNKDAKVMLLNGAGINGLASEWKKALRDQDWTGIDTGNGERTDTPGVYYKRDEDAGTAGQLAAYLGVEATQSDQYPSNITMVVTDHPQDLASREQ